MNKKYYVNVKELMNILSLPNPRLKKPKKKIPIISITVELWSDLNVNNS